MIPLGEMMEHPLDITHRLNLAGREIGALCLRVNRRWPVPVLIRHADDES